MNYQNILFNVIAFCPNCHQMELLPGLGGGFCPYKTNITTFDFRAYLQDRRTTIDRNWLSGVLAY